MKIDYPLNFIRTHSSEETQRILKNFLESSKYILITGKTSSKEISSQFINKKEFRPFMVFEVDSHNHEYIDSLAHDLLDKNIKYVVSIGGGVVVDFAKRLSLLSKFKLISIPTIVSNDGMASPISVLKISNKKKSLPGKLPDIILIPMNIIQEAPERYLKAAILDTLSNLSAINDWKYAEDGLRFDHSNSMAINLSMMAANMVLNIKNLELTDKRILECALDVQLLSGMAMTVSGTSRPCSGSEHIISHALDDLQLEPDILHGEKVGIISEFTLFLQGKDIPEVSILLRKLGIDKGIPGLKDFSKEKVVDFFSFAKKLRPERITILAKYSSKELYEMHSEFIKN
tara:strand:+ start:427 stop:1458 length:1032 start_codon:yes stop_codon:yes gene_type:complete